MKYFLNFLKKEINCKKIFWDLFHCIFFSIKSNYTLKKYEIVLKYFRSYFMRNNSKIEEIFLGVIS